MLKKGDVLVAAVVLLLFGGFSFLLLGANGARADQVRIRTWKEEFVYPLGEDRTIRVRGPLGESEIEIKDSMVRFASSPCPNGLCLQGSIGAGGGTLVCLPNLVSVRIERAEETVGGEVDDVAY